MPVTRSETRRLNALAAALGPTVTQPTHRRSQQLLCAAANTVEHAPVQPPPITPPIRRSRRLQGRPPSPPPARVLALPRIRTPPPALDLLPAPAPPPVPAPPPAPAPQPHWYQPISPTLHGINPMAVYGVRYSSLMTRDQWSWAIPTSETIVATQQLSVLTNHRDRSYVHYPITPAGLDRREHQPSVDDGYLWDMI